MRYADPLVVDDPASCRFYHRMEIPGHGVVGGQWDLRAVTIEYLGGVDFTGKRALDVGAASGFLSFEMERRGAEVVSFDMRGGEGFHVVPYYDRASEMDDLRQKFVRDHRAVRNAYWLAHRAYGSRARTRLCTDTVVICNQTSPEDRGEEPYAHFIPTLENSEPAAWWGLSIGCLKNMLSILGFEVVRTVSCEPECLVPGRVQKEHCTAIVAEHV